MASTRLAARTLAILRPTRRAFTTPRPALADLNSRGNDTAEAYRKQQGEKPLNPHMTNTTSTVANEMPNIGRDAAPPEFISSVDPDFLPKDAVPENTERMTGDTQEPGPGKGPNEELDVGEMEGAKFRVEPLRRTGEDVETVRARLLCPSLDLERPLPHAHMHATHARARTQHAHSTHTARRWHANTQTCPYLPPPLPPLSISLAT